MKDNPTSKRLLSLDVLRGITVAGMILVNDGYGESYAMLQHAEWNGLTPCDLVFPFFLYMVGISTYLSLRKLDFRMSALAARKIVRRTLLIFLIGLGINWLAIALGGDWGLQHLRIMAVLQRIAICYGVVALLALLMNHRYVVPVAVGLLAVYAVILVTGNGYANDDSNIAVIVDRAVLGESHLYRWSNIDPEGLLGTLPAIAHTLIGFACGRLMTQADGKLEKVVKLLLAGAGMVFGGYLLQYGLPLNKHVWSPSYVLMTCGLASLLLGMLMYGIDIKGNRRWTTPFVVFGVNPLFLYVFSELLAIFCWQWGVNELVYNGIHSVVTDACLASLCFALTYVLVCGLVGWWLYARRIYIKI